MAYWLSCFYQGRVPFSAVARVEATCQRYNLPLPKKWWRKCGHHERQQRVHTPNHCQELRTWTQVSLPTCQALTALCVTWTSRTPGTLSRKDTLNLEEIFFACLKLHSMSASKSQLPTCHTPLLVYTYLSISHVKFGRLHAYRSSSEILPSQFWSARLQMPATCSDDERIRKPALSRKGNRSTGRPANNPSPRLGWISIWTDLQFGAQDTGSTHREDPQRRITRSSTKMSTRWLAFLTQSWNCTGDRYFKPWPNERISWFHAWQGARTLLGAPGLAIVASCWFSLLRDILGTESSQDTRARTAPSSSAPRARTAPAGPRSRTVAETFGSHCPPRGDAPRKNTHEE